MKNTVEPLHNGHLGHKPEWPLERRGRYVFAGLQHNFKMTIRQSLINWPLSAIFNRQLGRV